MVIARVSSFAVKVLAGLFVCVLLATLVAVPGQAQESIDMTEFKWVPTDSAPLDYPMRLHEGYFTFADGGGVDIPDKRTIHPGWGKFASTRIVGEMLKPIPTTLTLTYFSFAEDTFWGGSFDLPQDRIEAFFEKGIVSPVTGEPTNYSRIMVGMGPEGEVSIWMMGEGIVHEVATYIAEPVEVEWEAFFSDVRYTRQEFIEKFYIDAVGYADAKRFLAEGVSPGRWQKFRRQLPWSFEIIADTPPTSFWLHSFNGEREHFNLMRPVPERAERAVPKFASFNWMNAAGKKYTAEISFDEEEVYAAFAKLLNGPEAGKLRLVFEIGDDKNGVAVTLRNDRFVYAFEKARVMVGRRN